MPVVLAGEVDQLPPVEKSKFSWRECAQRALRLHGVQAASLPGRSSSRVNPLPQVLRGLRAHAVPVGAAVAANTGAAGAIHLGACFAGMPAPTGTALASGSRCTCGSGFSREHRRSRCHTPRRLLRGLARSHRYCAGFGLTLYLWERPWPRTPAQPVPCTASPASRACPLPQVLRWLQVHAVPVGAAVAANNGAADAIASYKLQVVQSNLHTQRGSKALSHSGDKHFIVLIGRLGPGALKFFASAGLEFIVHAVVDLSPSC